MIALMDNLLSAIVGSVVMMILITSAMRVQTLNVDTTAAYAARNMASETMTWMEDDLMRIGLNMPGNTSPILAPRDTTMIVGSDTTLMMGEFRFVRAISNPAYDPDTSPASVPIQLLVGTRYRTVSEGTRAGSGGAYPVFRIERDTMLVDPTALPFDVATETFTRVGIDNAFRSNSGNWARAGGTPPLLRQFDLGFVSAEMDDVPNDEVVPRYDGGEALNVRLRLSIAPPFETATSTLRSIQHAATLMIMHDGQSLAVAGP